MKLIPLLVVLLTICRPDVRGQAASEPQDDAVTTKNEFTVWAGGSPNSSVLFGTTKHARLFTANVRYARIFRPGGNVALRYTVDLVPVTVLSYPVSQRVPAGNGTFTIGTSRRTAYGWGLAPVGLQINFRRRSKFQPFIGAAGGFIYFNKPVPTSLGTKFNFTADVGVGAQIMLRGRKAVSVGYKYHHISNGYRGTINPGFDSNLIYAAFSVLR